jgi:AcrR family transcriptional regulator
MVYIDDRVTGGKVMTERRYRLRKRAEGMARTRQRIVEATSDLHRTVGPAATQVTEIARRAGVQRVTVYKHFPDDAGLFAACSAHWRALHPAPDPAGWRSTADATQRLRRGLRELYSWYRETEPMTANILRDAEVLPALRTVVDDGLGAYLARVGRLLGEAFQVQGRRGEVVDAAIRVAVDFHTWRALATLGDETAAELASGLVELAAHAPLGTTAGG